MLKTAKKNLKDKKKIRTIILELVNASKNKMKAKCKFPPDIDFYVDNNCS